MKIHMGECCCEINKKLEAENLLLKQRLSDFAQKDQTYQPNCLCEKRSGMPCKGE